VLNNLLERLVL